jgi:hypothetical protein
MQKVVKVRSNLKQENRGLGLTVHFDLKWKNEG